MHVGEHRPGATQAGLNFIKDQQHAALVAQAAHGGEVPIGWDDDAGFALDRLQQHGAGRLVDHCGKRPDVAKVEVAEARSKRAEVGAIVGLGGEANDRGRAPMEVAARHRNRRSVRRDPLAAVAPATGRVNERSQKWAEGGRVIGARRDRELLRLLDERPHQARMRVPVADGRIGRHEIKVASSGRVPQPTAIPAL